LLGMLGKNGAVVGGPRVAGTRMCRALKSKLCRHGDAQSRGGAQTQAHLLKGDEYLTFISQYI